MHIQFALYKINKCTICPHFGFASSAYNFHKCNFDCDESPNYFHFLISHHMVQYYLDIIWWMLPKYLFSFQLLYKYIHRAVPLMLKKFLFSVPGKTSKTDRNSCSHQLCECDREFAMCLQKYLPCPKSKAVCKNKKRLWQNLLMGFGSGKGVHDPKHKVCACISI